MLKRFRNHRGNALIETSITIPIVLLICVGIFEFGRAYQTWQVITNAAREGARVAILPDATEGKVFDAARNYMKGGQLQKWESAKISLEPTVPFGSNTASRVTVTYPFDFTVLNPVIQLIKQGSGTGKGTTYMTSSALMRNE